MAGCVTVATADAAVVVAAACGMMAVVAAGGMMVAAAGVGCCLTNPSHFDGDHEEELAAVVDDVLFMIM